MAAPLCYRFASFSLAPLDPAAGRIDNILGAIAYVQNVNGKVVHGGFYNQFDGIRTKSNLDQEVSECTDPIWVGHSLGGAMAAIARQYYGKGSLNTYGAPAPFAEQAQPDDGWNGWRTWHEARRRHAWRAR